jgi:acyl dehydratase
MTGDPDMAAVERWFQDFAVGDVAEFGDYLITEDEILGFARQYDPQPFHTDPAAAAAGPYGGLIASGWNSSAIMMRLLVEHYVPANASMGSPGVDAIRWTAPVRPGDRLRLKVTVLETIASRSKPDRGVVRSLTEMFNQNGVLVMSLTGMIIYRKRPES